MTPEELDKARAEEAWRIYMTNPPGMTGERLAMIAARLAREGWTPPPPVDPDVVAFRKWMDTNPLEPRPWTEQNRYDNLLCDVFCQGARMAREQEQTRALAVSDRLAQALKDYGNWDNCEDALEAVLAAYKAERGWGAKQ